MLCIDDKNLKITFQKIYIEKFGNNGDDGYNICIDLKFENEKNIQGYLNLSAGFEKTSDINVFLNKEYNGVPYENDEQFIWFEVFDTEKLLDTQIENNIKIKIGNMKNNKVEVFFKLNDKLIKIKFNGYIKYEQT